MKSVGAGANRYEEAESYFRKAIEFRQKLVGQQPRNPLRRKLLGHVQIYLGRALLAKGQAVEAERVLRTAIAIIERLVNDYPGGTKYRMHLRLAYGYLVSALSSQGRIDEAIDTGVQALAFYDSQATDSKSETDDGSLTSTTTAGSTLSAEIPEVSAEQP